MTCRAPWPSWRVCCAPGRSRAGLPAPAITWALWRSSCSIRPSGRPSGSPLWDGRRHSTFRRAASRSFSPLWPDEASPWRDASHRPVRLPSRLEGAQAMRSWLVLSVVVAVGPSRDCRRPRRTAPPATITTVAGNGVDGHTGDGGLLARRSTIRAGSPSLRMGDSSSRCRSFLLSDAWAQTAASRPWRAPRRRASLATAGPRLPPSSISSTAWRCSRTGAWCWRTRATTGSDGWRKTGRSRPSPARGRSATRETAARRPRRRSRRREASPRSRTARSSSPTRATIACGASRLPVS